MYDPATGRIARQVAFADPGDVDAAVAAARAAFAAWRATSLAERARVLFRFRELLAARADELAAIITAEHGKTIDDAMRRGRTRPRGRRVRVRRCRTC